MKDIRDYMTKKYPTNKYIQCPIPERCWQDIVEYAEYYYQAKLKLLGLHNGVCSATRCMSCEAEIKKDEGILFCSDCGM